jgi:hypothetical protein
MNLFAVTLILLLATPDVLSGPMFATLMSSFNPAFWW